MKISKKIDKLITSLIVLESEIEDIYDGNVDIDSLTLDRRRELELIVGKCYDIGKYMDEIEW